ncbi:hypothetical protein [Verrucosispora sp. NA02020]|uniref:hypothetical protein n=1 Tax=unclassified Micromonospora TaxID=2617518 RepID=UPI0020CA881F|nr:hypothetical protein [Verrucosispora sp. NA02020]
MTTASPGNTPTHHAVPRQPERSWWQRIFSPMPVAPVPVPRPAPVRVTFRQDVPRPMLVPAKGDAFDFCLYVAYLWTASNMPFEELQMRAEGLLPWARSIVRERVIDLAREYEPHRAHDLERALNNVLMHQRWPQEQGQLPQFGVRIRVSPEDRVRERLRPYWEERIRLECDHELQKIRARQADELTRRWGTVLRDLEDDPVTAHAAALAGEQFADIFRRYVEERRGSVPDLVRLLREAVKGHSDLALGPSEYTQAWDLALRTYERQHGLSEQVN